MNDSDLPGLRAIDLDGLWDVGIGTRHRNSLPAPTVPLVAAVDCERLSHGALPSLVRWLVGTPEESRTPNLLDLNQAPLPVGPRGRTSRDEWRAPTATDAWSTPTAFTLTPLDGGYGCAATRSSTHPLGRRSPAPVPAIPAGVEPATFRLTKAGTFVGLRVGLVVTTRLAQVVTVGSSWSLAPGSNWRPSPYHGDALPTAPARLGDHRRHPSLVADCLHPLGWGFTYPQRDSNPRCRLERAGA